jgi:LCP family protein required for cell wall assembly
VLVAHLDSTDHSISLLSIPRDTFVPGARSGNILCGGTWSYTPGLCANKIDSSLIEGPDQLAQAIEQDFGIPINHIVDLNFATFEGVVNALGGLWMYFPYKLVDASSGLYVEHTGCIHLNGTEALAYVRARHVFYFTKKQTPNVAAIKAANTPSGPWYTPDSGGSYDGSGDLGRILRVHLFLKALAQQVQARGLGNPGTDNSLIGAIAPNLTTDNGLSGLTLVKLAFDYRQAKVGDAPELTLPTINDAATYYYEGGSYGDVIFPSEPQDQQAIDAFLGTKPSGWKLSPSSISVSVIDGTNSAPETASVASQLHRLGYRIVSTNASRDVGPVSETTVLYNGRAHLQQAEKVMSSLSGAVVLGQGTPAGGADVSVVTGSILAVAKGATSSPSSTTTPTTAPSTTTVPTTTNPNIGAPTSSNPAIPPWDARSCPKIPG